MNAAAQYPRTANGLTTDPSLGASQLRLFDGSETRFDHDLRQRAPHRARRGLVARPRSRLARAQRDAARQPRQGRRLGATSSAGCTPARWRSRASPPSIPVLADAPDPLLRAIGTTLSLRYGVLYDSAWLNRYRDHRDSTAWHADRGRLDRCIVPVLSLGGETRRFAIRPQARRRQRRSFVAEGGDLFVMGGFCQRDWVHCVPKETTRAGVRISVNFGSSEQSTRRT